MKKNDKEGMEAVQTNVVTVDAEAVETLITEAFAPLTFLSELSNHIDFKREYYDVFKIFSICIDQTFVQLHDGMIDLMHAEKIEKICGKETRI